MLPPPALPVAALVGPALLDSDFGAPPPAPVTAFPAGGAATAVDIVGVPADIGVDAGTDRSEVGRTEELVLIGVDGAAARGRNGACSVLKGSVTTCGLFVI